MALLFCDGFEDAGSLQKWTTYSNGVLTAGRYGQGMYFWKPDIWTPSGYIQRSIPQSGQVCVGFAIKLAVLQQQPYLVFYTDVGATAHTVFTVTATGFPQLRRGSEGGTLLASATATLSVGVWYYIEVKTTIDDTSGIAELRIDGQTVASFTGDTRNGGTGTSIDYIALQPAMGNNCGATYDDLYILDSTGATNNDFLGDIRIETLYPDGNGNSSQLVGSDADSTDNYQLVDETGTPSSADYVASGNLGDKDTYTFTGLATTSGTIKGVQVNSWAAKSDSGVRNVKNITRLSGTEDQSASLPLQTTYMPHLSVHETKPGGGSWTISDVNNAEFGVQVD